MENGFVSFRRNKDKFGAFGNMYPTPIMFDGVEWRTTEALFQALRFSPSHPAREEIRNQPSPIIAKRVAKEQEGAMHIQQKSSKDLDNMLFVLILKAAQHNWVWHLLKSTGTKLIIEDVGSRKDRFWGAAFVNGKWEGGNYLGECWMALKANPAREHMLYKFALHFACVRGPNSAFVAQLLTDLNAIHPGAHERCVDDVALDIIGG